MKVAVAHEQVISNIMAFETRELSFINSLISETDKTTSREVILNLKELEDESKDTNIFILVEKNRYRHFVLFHKKKYHRNTSTIANYIAAIMVK